MPPSYSESSGEWIIEFHSITEEEVLKLVMPSSNKQSSLDPLPIWLFKKIGVDVALFNRSFEEGYVPSCFKKAIVAPLIKIEGLDSDDLCSFHPISNVALVSKMLERLLCERINIHLEKIGIFSSVQSAYHRNYSTETALVIVVSDIIMAAEAGDVTMLVLLDLSAAFDTAYHAILLQCLQPHIT